jgi:YVTN family beta-propeller protein
VGIPRDWMGFKDGITNPDTTNTTQMNRQVWVQPGPPEPAWTAGGTYQAVRIIRMFLNKWATVPVGEQERIFGQRKISGTPLYTTSPTASDNLDPIYTNDPQGLLTPLNSHIRLANPQTPQTAATSAILRHSYQYDRSPDVQGNPDMGHAFCCFRQQLAIYLATAGDQPARLGIGLCGRPTIPDRLIYVTNQLDNTLSVIDASTYSVVATVSLPAGSSPRGVALTLNGQFLYVADGGSNNVSVLDTRTNRIVASVPVGSQPVNVAVTPDGASAYVANTGSSDVSVIDTQTNRVVRVVPAGQYPAGVAVTHDGGSVYVANELSAIVTVINTRSGAVEATLPSGTGPFNAAATRHALYVTNQGVNTLSVIDPHTQCGDHREDRQQSLRRGSPTRARSITEPLLKGVTSSFGDHARCG